MSLKLWSVLTLSTSIALSACSTGNFSVKDQPLKKDPYPSTYQALPAKALLIENAVVLTGDGRRLDNTDLLIQGGQIQQIGSDLVDNHAIVIEAEGKWVTPGLIDVHSHLGAYPSPGVESHQDGNEMTSPNTAEVWVEHSVWPQDPGFHRAREGGVTTLQILPGSANLFGGRTVTLKNIPSNTVQGMKFPEAQYGLKMACGENPKRVYGERQEAPGTRMGNMAGYRQAWIAAMEYKEQWEAYETEKSHEKPARDLKLETLRGVLDGDILIHNHCYKAEEMAMMIDLSKEFSYHAGTFHHGIEAYKVADLLAENGICAALWPDWWGFKMEAYDMVLENVAIVDAVKNSCAIVHSDSPYTIQRLNQEVGKIMFQANHNGFDIKPEQAIRWITFNAAKSLGIENQVGSIVTGKQADIVLWDRNPFSVYAKAEQVFIDGAKVYDRFDDAYQAESDFMLGQE